MIWKDGGREGKREEGYGRSEGRQVMGGRVGVGKGKK